MHLVRVRHSRIEIGPTLNSIVNRIPPEDVKAVIPGNLHGKSHFAHVINVKYLRIGGLSWWALVIHMSP